MNESEKNEFAESLRRAEMDQASKKIRPRLGDSRIATTVTKLHEFAPAAIPEKREKRARVIEKRPELGRSHELDLSGNLKKYYILKDTGKLEFFRMGTAVYKDRFKPGNVFKVLDPKRKGADFYVKCTEISYALEAGGVGSDGIPAKRSHLYVSFERIES